MALYKIQDSCVSCGACVSFCKQNAILQNNTKYIIDPLSCTGCGDCVFNCSLNSIIESHLIVNNKSVSDIYIGTKKINTIYLGSKKIY